MSNSLREHATTMLRVRAQATAGKMVSVFRITQNGKIPDYVTPHVRIQASRKQYVIGLSMVAAPGPDFAAETDHGIVLVFELPGVPRAPKFNRRQLIPFARCD